MCWVMMGGDYLYLAKNNHATATSRPITIIS